MLKITTEIKNEEFKPILNCNLKIDMEKCIEFKCKFGKETLIKELSDIVNREILEKLV
jgi:hypothetical protein